PSRDNTAWIVHPSAVALCRPADCMPKRDPESSLKTLLAYLDSVRATPSPYRHRGDDLFLEQRSRFCLREFRVIADIASHCRHAAGSESCFALSSPFRQYSPRLSVLHRHRIPDTS